MGESVLELPGFVRAAVLPSSVCSVRSTLEYGALLVLGCVHTIFLLLTIRVLA